MRALGEAWPRLVGLVRAGAACGAEAPALLLLLLMAWIGRVAELGDASPLLRAKERREVRPAWCIQSGPFWLASRGA